MSGGRAGSTSTSSVTYSLSGGSNSTPQAGDLVIVTVEVSTQGRNPACAVTAPGTWGGNLGLLHTTSTTYDTSLDVSWKFMGGTPDTTFTLPSTGNIADAQSYTVQVWRGVDTTDLFDVTPAYATGTATGRPNPNYILPQTSGAYVLICAGGAAATGATYTAPTGYTTNFLTNTTADTNDSMVGSGYMAWTSNQENPAAYTGGTTGANDSWCAYTIALRPTVTATDASILFGDGVQTGSLNYLYRTSGPDLNTGMLICGWIHTPQVRSSYPYTLQDSEPFSLSTSNWDIWCVAGNMQTATTSAEDSKYQACVTISGSVGDKMTYVHGYQPETMHIGWVFVAWHITCNDTDGILINQYVKFGLAAPILHASAQSTIAEYRTASGNGSWLPSPTITRLNIGADTANAGSETSIKNVRVYETATLPTEAELNRIAANSEVDRSAWADYALGWSGSADTTDRSGNGRNLSLDTTGGPALAQGWDFASISTRKIYCIQSPAKSSYTDDYGHAVTTLSASFDTAPTINNFVIVQGGTTDEYGGSVTVADNQGNSFTVRRSNYATDGTTSFVAFLKLPAQYTGTYTVTASHLGVFADMRISEYAGIEGEDWYKTTTTPGTNPTLTADSADTRAGTMIAVAFTVIGQAGFSDYPVLPAGFNVTLSVDGYSDYDGDYGGSFGRKICPIATTESVTFPTQAGTESFIPVMVGFKPSIEVAKPPYFKRQAINRSRTY